MSAIDTLFQELRASGRKAFMPFVTAGDPDLDFTAKMLQELVRRGSHLCELGIPYSDPIADGPVIQASYTRALAKGIHLDDIFRMCDEVMPTLAAPVVTMVSYAIVYRRGPARYVREAHAAGIAGAIVPDLPVEESQPLAEVCRAADFSLIQLITPTTPRERAVKIAQTSSGFIYYVSVTGITGERTELPQRLLDDVAWLRTQTPLPVCIGFGISRPEHVKLLAPAADGLIVGSGIVRRVAEAAGASRQEALQHVGQYVSELIGALP
jgi:tryptophan synthase alpha chain